MRVEFAYDMTDDLARTGNEVLLRHQLRGVGWRSALVWFLLALTLYLVLANRGVHWGWILTAGVAAFVFFLVLLVVLGIPSLHAKRLQRYLEQMAGWPHRRVAIVLTPDIVELTTPVASGLFDRRDLAQIVSEPDVTILLFRGGILVPVPTEQLPEAARQLLGILPAVPK